MSSPLQSRQTERKESIEENRRTGHNSGAVGRGGWEQSSSGINEGK
jgi:hypothetical protein